MSAAAGQTKKIRVAVVGTGEFGRNHARVYREIRGRGTGWRVRQESPSAPRKSRRNFRRRHFRGLEELRGRADAVSVAVPTVEHAAVGCRLMEMGLDVLVEKPMATNLAEADALLDAAKRIRAHPASRPRGAIQSRGPGG